MPFYLRPSAPTAADALICGDPARALAIAQHVMVQPRMSNHNRGLWGYHGETPDGIPLTVQATGIGGPSAVAVLSETIDLGVRRLIRIGTCAATGDGPKLGASRIVERAIAEDGASRRLAGSEQSPANPELGSVPDPELTAALASSTGLPGATVRSVDVIGGDLGAVAAVGESGGGEVVVDLQTAAVLTLCRQRGVQAAVGLVVRSVDGRPLHDDPLDAALLRLADGGVAAIGGAPKTLNVESRVR